MGLPQPPILPEISHINLRASKEPTMVDDGNGIANPERCHNYCGGQLGRDV